MKVSNELRIYEIDGSELPIGEMVIINVKSHWNRNEMVVICIGGKSYTVNAAELERAVENATNWK